MAKFAVNTLALVVATNTQQKLVSDSHQCLNLKNRLPVTLPNNLNTSHVT